jgi:FlaA1/EpsC-like NDP-sugar epimerase
VHRGLRPGEKLYEELLIDADSQPTSHPLIYRAEEQAIAPELLWQQIDALEAAIQRHDEAAALEVLAELVPAWMRGDGVGEFGVSRAVGSPADLTGSGP